MYPLWLVILGLIWKHTMEKSQTSATNVIMHPFMLAIWGHIWKRTVENSQTNATNVTLLLLWQAIWGDIWKHTKYESPDIRTNVNLHPSLDKCFLEANVWFKFSQTIKICKTKLMYQYIFQNNSIFPQTKLDGLETDTE